MQVKSKLRSRTAAKRKLWALLRQQNHGCFRCGKKILRIGHIKTCREIVKISSEFVQWVSPCGMICKAYLATVDHTVPCWNGGDNQWSNLTAMCYRCNHLKHKEEIAHFKKHEKRVCRTCGKRIKKLRRRNCSDCRMGTRHPSLTGASK